MAKSCRCKKPAECEECPEWIFTFADLVMLMMGFFVILWVLKPSATPPPAKAGDAPGDPSSSAAAQAAQAAQDRWLETVGAIRGGFGYVPEPGSKDPVDQAIERKRRQAQQPFKGPGDGGETKEPKKGAVGTDPLVTVVRPGTH